MESLGRRPKRNDGGDGQGRPQKFFQGGKRRICYLLDRIKLYSCNQDFAKGLKPKVKWSCSKNVAIGRHVEQVNAIQVGYIMDKVWKRSP